MPNKTTGSFPDEEPLTGEMDYERATLVWENFTSQMPAWVLTNSEVLQAWYTSLMQYKGSVEELLADYVQMANKIQILRDRCELKLRVRRHFRPNK